MILHRIAIGLIITVFIHMLYLIIGTDSSVNNTLASTLPIVIIVLLIIPIARFTTSGFERLLKIWKDGDNETK